MTVIQRINALRQEMKARGMAAYIVPSDDFHSSEYVGDYFKCREYLSGFTGSAGTLLVLENSAHLWTDGRYFIQAAQQLSGSGIELMKMNTDGCPTIQDLLSKSFGKAPVIGFDGRTVTAQFAASLTEKLPEARLMGDEDLAGIVWTDRPEISKKPVWELSPALSGNTRAERLAMVREKLAEAADLLVLPGLEDIAWLLNLRGGDIACTPVFLAYMTVERDRALLFAHRECFTPEILEGLEADGVTLLPYNDIIKTLPELTAGKVVWADESKLSYSLSKAISAAERQVKKPSPTELLKAVKTPAELKGMAEAHLKDGEALTRFIYWIKTHIGKESITELSASDKLLEFRSQQPDFLGISFDTIMGYGPHGAIVHYEPTPESDISLEAKGFCLVDSGGHYLQGTTDVTRTIALGELTQEEKQDFTLVLISHLRLGDARFKAGATGATLDMLAREPLWRRGMDYAHGTGHGVGYILSVHEGPQRITYNVNSAVIKPGMIISNEPGLYLTDKFGIRHENLVVCRELEKNGFGTFLGFESLTMVPFDLDAIDLSLMSERDVELLNAYHKKVWEALSPRFEGEELAWLRKATTAV